MQEYFLCGDCEELLNQRGERWTLDNCHQRRGDFPILRHPGHQRPLMVLEDFAVFGTASVAEIDAPQLAYFAASVFWRASARPWKFAGNTTQIEVGTGYQEQLRLYLLGAAELPRNTPIWVAVSPSPNPTLAICTPYTTRFSGFHQRRFTIPGIVFHLFLGQRLGPEVRFLCAIRSPGNLITMRSRVDENVATSLVDVISRAKTHRSRRPHQSGRAC